MNTKPQITDQDRKVAALRAIKEEKETKGSLTKDDAYLNSLWYAKWILNTR